MLVEDPPLSHTRVAERSAVEAATFLAEVAEAGMPVVLRGQVRDWPAIAAGMEGDRSMASYLAGFGTGQPLDVMIAAPQEEGRFFYNDDLTGFNFHRQPVALHQLLHELVRFSEENVAAPHALYAGSAAAPAHLPGWQSENPLNLPTSGAPARLWIGNATRIATHYDESDNLACAVYGRRRFTLFPPDQIGNLYVGPLDQTIAGPPSSLVDPDAPDLARFPRFAEAARHAQIADLEPGDALFIPALWWHHVRAFDRLNVLVNYWWGQPDAGSPFPALIHAMMSVRDLPPAAKAAWRVWFDHYVFADDAAAVAAHLPASAHGVLASANPARTERIRGFLLRMLGNAAPR
ncbi:cupin-like domain-containing protein [Sphingomonas sp. Y38-1Y]|uniref:cupin-like domain-containing protein n=1 Tax=Sphingomonas sp. Y38-1Y TaxID=3078265 RepID=UPI0028EAF70F|nr:cupin-like domain-containing protein [Sphingomonas sp. Y38-1Y]